LQYNQKKIVMTLQEDFCSYETSKKLKELGFDMYYCMAWRWFDENTQELVSRYELTSEWVAEKYIIDAPTLELANKWLRETYNIEVMATPIMKNIWKCRVFYLKDGYDLTEYNDDRRFYQDFKTKEEALRFGIDTVITDIIKNDGKLFKD